MQIEKYEIMKKCEQLNDKIVEMTFKKIAYIFVKDRENNKN